MDVRIKTDIRRRDIESAANWMSGLIGSALDKRVAGFEQHERRNPLLVSHYRDNFALEFALAKARRCRKRTGRLPTKGEFDIAYGFMVGAHRIYGKLPASGKRSFEGRLRDAVKGFYGARPFAYEIGVAAHLMKQGWDVECPDLAGAARYDFLARRNDVTIEVECKTTSGDTGRKIHRQEVNRLADLLVPIAEALIEEKGCHLVRVTVPGRLRATDEELRKIASTVAAAANKKSVDETDLVRAEYSLPNIAEWPDARDDPNAREFFLNLFGGRNSHVLIHSRYDYSIVVFSIASSDADQVIDAIAEQAKLAADQCTGERSALITLQLIDQMSLPVLETLLKTQSGVQSIAHSIFKDSKRSHVDSIAFTVPLLSRPDGVGMRRSSAPALILYNPQPKFPCADARSIFST